MTLFPTNESQKNLKNTKNCALKSRDLGRSVTKKSDDYDSDKKYIKIKFDSGDELPVSKRIKIPTIAIVVRAIFLENNKHLQVFLDECLHKI